MNKEQQLKDEVLSAWVDLLLTTPEECHIYGELRDEDVNDNVQFWCAVGLFDLLPLHLFDKLDPYVPLAWEEEDDVGLIGGELNYRIAAWLWGGNDSRVIEDNDSHCSSFREIAEHAKAGIYTDDEAWFDYQQERYDEDWED